MLPYRAFMEYILYEGGDIYRPRWTWHVLRACKKIFSTLSDKPNQAASIISAAETLPTYNPIPVVLITITSNCVRVVLVFHSSKHISTKTLSYFIQSRFEFFNHSTLYMILLHPHPFSAVEYTQ